MKPLLTSLLIVIACLTLVATTLSLGDDPIVTLPFPPPHTGPNEATFVNHSGGPILINVKCFHHIEDPGVDFVIPHDGSEDFVITCPERSE